MKFLLYIIPVLVVSLAGCITQFVPETNEVQDLLVVITERGVEIPLGALKELLAAHHFALFQIRLSVFSE